MGHAFRASLSVKERRQMLRKAFLRTPFATFLFTTLLLLLAASAQSPVSSHLPSYTPHPRIPVNAVPRAFTGQRAPGKAGSRMATGGEPIGSGEIVFVMLPSVFYESGGSPDSVAIADVNGDGKLDLLVVNCSVGACIDKGSIGVLLGNGDGTFLPAVTYDSGGYAAVDVAVADVNGDGKPDLLVANCGTQFDCFGTGSAGVLLGNGDGTFKLVVSYDTVGGAGASIAVADVNGDNKPDLLVATWFGGVSVFLGNGNGTFQAAVAYKSGDSPTKSIAVADVNGDGNPDLIVANCGSNANCDGNGSAGVLLGNGDGTFQTVVIYDTGGASGFTNGSSARSVAVGDVNGDGRPDLLMANFNAATIGVLLGNGNGTFQPAVTYNVLGPFAPSSGPFAIALADVSGDGKPDVLVSAYGVGYLLGNGDGTFRPPVFFDPQQGVLSLAVGDVNGDDKPDVAAVGYYTQVMLNNSGAPPTTTALVSSVNPVTVKQPVTYTASVSPSSGGTVKGSVQFMDGPNPIAVVPLKTNQAALTLSYSSRFVSPRTITVIYSGDLDHAAGSFSNAVVETVRGLTMIKMTTSGSPSLVGLPVTFTANISSKDGAIPNGDLVTFSDGKTPLASISLSGGKAVFATASLSRGTHTIKATYGGDSTFAPSTKGVQQIVNGYTSSTALSSNHNPSHSGQAITFTAQVTSSDPHPLTGTIKFMDGTTLIGTRILSAGVATLSKSNLTVGTHSITAIYKGDDFFDPSASLVLNQAVNP